MRLSARQKRPVGKPSIAIIYDKFLVQGGGERVCEILVEAFPEAKLYALNAKPRKFWEEKLGRPIISPPFGWLFSSRFLVTALYPLAALLMALIRVRADTVIAYSSTCGKYVQLDCRESILYSNYPNRGLYQPEKMIGSKMLRVLLAPIMAIMRPLERLQIRKFDRKFSISETSRQAMLDFSGIDTDVLMPPFDEQNMSAATGGTSHRSGDDRPFFVLVSRLEPEKELDYVIQAFRQSDRALRVIGTGSQLAQFRRELASNITFLGYVDDATLARNLMDAEALIFPSEIEYSLVPLEAVSLGTPVIAFDSPAMREILIEDRSDGGGANAVFFADKTATALIGAIAVFDKIEWDDAAIKRGAEPFGKPAFIERIRGLVHSPAGHTFQGPDKR